MKLSLELHNQEAAKISHVGGVVVVEPMRFLYPYQAKLEANAQRPKACAHVCNRRPHW